MITRLNGLVPVLLLAACSSNSQLVDTDYRLDFGAMHTDVRFTSGSVTRTGPGFHQTDAARIRTLSGQRYFIQWQEEDRTFVTLLLDLGTMNVYTSILPGRAESEPRFLAGTVTKRGS